MEDKEDGVYIDADIEDLRVLFEDMPPTPIELNYEEISVILSSFQMSGLYAAATGSLPEVKKLLPTMEGIRKKCEAAFQDYYDNKQRGG